MILVKWFSSFYFINSASYGWIVIKLWKHCEWWWKWRQRDKQLLEKHSLMESNPKCFTYAMISQLSIYLLHIHLCSNHIILTTQTFSKSGFIHGQQILDVPNPKTKVVRFYIFLTNLFPLISMHIRRCFYWLCA